MIDQNQFEAYEIIILTGQVGHEEVPKLLDENPAFAEWYRARIKDRKEAAR